MAAVLVRGILLETYDGRLQADSNEHAECCLYLQKQMLLMETLPIYIITLPDSARSYS